MNHPGNGILKILLLPIALLFFGLLIVGAQSSSQNETAITLSMTDEVISAGERIFFEYCSGCHGKRADGRGMQAFNLVPKPQNLRNAQFVKYLTNERIYSSLSGGVRGTAMPAFENVLSSEQRKQVMSYIRSLTMDDEVNIPNSLEYLQVDANLSNPIESTPEVMATGKDLFLNYCAVCHGATADGRGMIAENLAPRPRNLVVVTSWGERPFIDYMKDARLFDSITNGVPGTSMLPWLKVLTDEERWSVIHFLRGEADRQRDKVEPDYQ